jgi:tetratricopeptide (TPR) repeat protein
MNVLVLVGTLALAIIVPALACGGVSPAQGAYDDAIRLYKQGDVAGAIAGLREALRLDPQYGQAHYSLCFIHHRREDNQAALNACSEGIRAAPDFADSYYMRGVILSEKFGEEQAAIRDFTSALRLKPDLEPAFFKRANARSRLGDLTGALADYGEALRLNPKNPDACFNRGVVRFKRGDREGAVADLEQAARIHTEQGNSAGAERARNAIATVRNSGAPK